MRLTRKVKCYLQKVNSTNKYINQGEKIKWRQKLIWHQIQTKQFGLF